MAPQIDIKFDPKHYFANDIFFGPGSDLINDLLKRADVSPLDDRDVPEADLAKKFTSMNIQQNEIPDEAQPLQFIYTNFIVNGLGTDKSPKNKKVLIIGAGTSGLCAGYELAKVGFDVQILEASSRVGGRVKTFREPFFAPGLHGEGGAMRIPKDHFLTWAYIDEFKQAEHDSLRWQSFPFEMKNKFIYLEALGKRYTYDEFNKMLINKSPEIQLIFPGLNPKTEQGKDVDTLFNEAIDPVVKLFNSVYDNNPAKITAAYAAITKDYDKYTLRSFLTEHAGWSLDALNLFDLANAHVVFENGFIESLKDSFLSSNTGGTAAGMRQLQDGTDAIPLGFIRHPKIDKNTLIDKITFGARVSHIDYFDNKKQPSAGSKPSKKIRLTYDTQAGPQETTGDYLVIAIPYTSLRAITKSEPFSPLKEMSIRSVRYVEVTKVLLQYRRRWWEEVFKNAGQGFDGGVVTDLPIRYTMFPRTEDSEMVKRSDRGIVMAAYTFEQDATELGAMSPQNRILLAARNLDTMFPEAKSLELLEVSASQVWPSDEMAGGSAFCYFGPSQKSMFLENMAEPEWDNRVYFAGEQASYSHGWIQGAFEAGLRSASQLYNNNASAPK